VFSLIRPDCAGIDLGSSAHLVAVPEGRCENEVRTFGCFTSDLVAMGAWFAELGIKDVAMESTGVYWVPVYEALAGMGFRVALVDGRSAKALPGRKTDVQDCQWIRDLYMHGLLQPCVVPEGSVLAIRSYWRQRGRIVEQRSEQIQLMQKALEQMNVQIHKVLTDISGVSGLAIVRAILSGERNPRVLSELLVGQARKKQDLVVKALEGRWADHHLFALEEAVQTYDFLGSRLQECDRRLDKEIAELAGDSSGSGSGRSPIGRRRSSKNEPEGEIHANLTKLLGCDPTQIDGIQVNTVATLVCELGVDLSRFRTEKHLSSYLGLCPENQITGGNIKKSRTKKVTHRAANALRMAAQSLHSSHSALGAYYRRLKARIGPAKAVTATARKIATLYYRLVVNGQLYADPGEEAYNEKFRTKSIQRLKKQATKLGLVVVEG